MTRLLAALRVEDLGGVGELAAVDGSLDRLDRLPRLDVVVDRAVHLRAEKTIS